MREDKGSIEFITGEIKGAVYANPEEKEYPHKIEKLNVTFFDYDVGTKIIKDKINEIIEVVNIMNRGR